MVSKPDLPTLTHRFSLLIRRAMGERMAAETWAVEAGFRPGCIGVLQTVAATGPVSQREVSERLLIDPSDLVSLIDILEGAGLVSRERDPADRRRYALNLTLKGELAVDRLDDVARDAVDAVLSALDPAEREQLAHLLLRVVASHLDVSPDAVAPAPRPAGS